VLGGRPVFGRSKPISASSGITQVRPTRDTPLSLPFLHQFVTVARVTFISSATWFVDSIRHLYLRKTFYTGKILPY